MYVKWPESWPGNKRKAARLSEEVGLATGIRSILDSTALGLSAGARCYSPCIEICLAPLMGGPSRRIVVRKEMELLNSLMANKVLGSHTRRCIKAFHASRPAKR